MSDRYWAGPLWRRKIARARTKCSWPARGWGGEIDARQAQTQIEAIQSQIGKTYPTTDSGWRVRARPLAEEFSGNARVSLLVLLGAVAFIMLIACANVANLLLSRAMAREREFAIRATL